jgi:3-oxoacyl-[acyl-carrier protein] reductase
MKAVTLITGTRKGLGRHLAEHYVERGHYVVGCSRGAADFSHEYYEHRCLDIADETAVVELFRSIRIKHKRLNNLINNAGIGSRNLVLLTPVATAMDVLRTNVVGTFLSCREGARLMARGGGGRIVNFGSVAVAQPSEGSALYAASKAAVLMLTQVLAQELAPFGITVNAVSPNPIETDLLRSVPRVEVECVLQRQAFPRVGTPADVVDIVDFFLGPAAGFVTGQNIFLGGVS